MRVATYNVHDCVGSDGHHEPQRIAEVLVELDVDLIALQEVTLDSAGTLMECFENATAMRAIDGSQFARGAGRFGNLLLTRKPSIGSWLHDLSVIGREPRGCIEMALEVNDGPFTVWATHLGLRPGERRVQISRLSRLAEVRRGAQLLLGDFNVWSRSRALGSLRALGFEQKVVRSFPTWPVPVVAFDRVLARPPAHIKRCWRHDSALARVASDHFPLIAELELRYRPHGD